MIFLPNNFEIYCSRLRSTLQFLIIKNGYKPKYLENLKKIHRAEALFSDYKIPIELNFFNSELLKAVYLKKLEQKKPFGFKLKTNGTFLINKKLYISFLLSLCENSCCIKASVKKDSILIISKGEISSAAKKLLKSLNGYFFYNMKSNTVLAVIPADRTSKSPIKTKKDWEYLLNPLSAVNIYLK